MMCKDWFKACLEHFAGFGHFEAKSMKLDQVEGWFLGLPGNWEEKGLDHVTYVSYGVYGLVYGQIGV